MTDDSNRNHDVVIAIPKKKLSAEEYIEKRAERAELCLWWLLKAAKAQTDPATWLNLGLLEAESFLEAIAEGGQHPLVKVYGRRVKKRGAGNPSVPLNERYARRFIVLGCLALEKAGLPRGKARARMTKQLKGAHLFLKEPSEAALESWERRMAPLSPADQAFIARAITRCGISNLGTIADYFIGQAQSLLNPGALAVV